MTADGQLSYISINNLKRQVNANQNLIVSTSIIKTNLDKVIKYEKFYQSSKYGIKDLLIFDDKIYISYSNMKIDGGYGQRDLDCFNTAILYGELNYNLVEFKKFYDSKDCVKRNNVYGFFNPHHAGGRMVAKDNKIIFTTGDYKFRDLAQENNNEMGKILELNLDGSVNKIISKGHRNPQGLFFNEVNNLLFSTEHGPNGGDEINIIKEDDENILNYGWPIASYGKYYTPDVEQRPNYRLPTNSHEDLGFVEPLKYYTPSVGVSQILGGFLLNNNIDYYLVGSMGELKKDHQTSLYLYKINGSNEIVEEHKLKLQERIRDIIYYNKENQIYLFLENSPSIGIISFNNS